MKWIESKNWLVAEKVCTHQDLVDAKTIVVMCGWVDYYLEVTMNNYDRIKYPVSDTTYRKFIKVFQHYVIHNDTEKSRVCDCAKIAVAIHSDDRYHIVGRSKHTGCEMWGLSPDREEEPCLSS